MSTAKIAAKTAELPIDRPPKERSPEANPLAQFIKERASDRAISDVMLDILRAKIVNGDLLPGSRIVEAELCKLYGVSRGSVREALRALATEGLIDVEKHRSPTVRGVDTGRFLQMFEVRSVLEGYAASLAASRLSASKENMKWAKQELADWTSRKNLRNPNQHVAANRDFHERIRQIAGQDVLAAQIKSLIMPGYRTILEPILTEAQMHSAATEHCQVLEAMIAGNSAAAEKAMRKHIAAAGQRAALAFTAQFFDPRMTELRRLEAM